MLSTAPSRRAHATKRSDQRSAPTAACRDWGSYSCAGCHLGKPRACARTIQRADRLEMGAIRSSERLLRCLLPQDLLACAPPFAVLDSISRNLPHSLCRSWLSVLQRRRSPACNLRANSSAGVGIAGVRCLPFPGDRPACAKTLNAQAANNGTFLGWDSNAWGTFFKTLGNGLPNGVRQPGQNLGECMSQNVSQMTFGS